MWGPMLAVILLHALVGFADGIVTSRSAPLLSSTRSRAPLITASSSMLDADGDGVITKEELDSASLMAIMRETDLYKEMSRQTRQV
jgi:hypothetical protein